MNGQSPFSELLCAFLDGELEGTEAETLFYTLAHDPDLQMEMRRFISLNTGFRKELLSPPAHLRERIEQRTQVSPSTRAVSTSLLAHLSGHLAGSRSLVVLFTAVASSLLTLYLAPDSNNRQPTIAAPTETPVRAYTDAHTFSLGIPFTSPSTIPCTQTGTPHNTGVAAPAAAALYPCDSHPPGLPHGRNDVRPRGNGRRTVAAAFADNIAPVSIASAPAGLYRRAVKHPVPERTTAHSAHIRHSAPPARRSHGTEVARLTSATISMIRNVAEGALRQAEALRNGLAFIQSPTALTPAITVAALHSPLSLSAPDTSPVHDEEFDALERGLNDHYHSTDRLFSVYLRGFVMSSAPDVEVDPLEQPDVTNTALGILYHFSPNHAVGVEMARENLLQRYNGTDESGAFTVEQHTLPLSVGAVWRYTLTDDYLLQPFVQGVVGGTNMGPFLRSTVGAQCPLGNVTLMVGLEGALHLYSYQSAWFTTRKFGASYGVSYRF